MLAGLATNQSLQVGINMNQDQYTDRALKRLEEQIDTDPNVKINGKKLSYQENKTLFLAIYYLSMHVLDETNFPSKANQVRHRRNVDKFNKLIIDSF